MVGHVVIVPIMAMWVAESRSVRDNRGIAFMGLFLDGEMRVIRPMRMHEKTAAMNMPIVPMVHGNMKR